ncbi:MAG: SLC13 family permease [Actinomycetota bacterium]
MNLDAVITVVVLVAMIGGLVTGRLSPPSAILGATAALYVAGVTSAAEAFSGFANPAPITVAGLYVIAGAIERTGAIQPLVSRVLGRPTGDRRDLARLTAPAAAASSLLANTPIVAMLVPAVTRWADQHRRSASTYLIPLSYATILGGSVTVIGTSTNLVVSGLLVQAGQEPLAMFDLARVGLPLALIGLAIIVALGPALLPARRRPRDVAAGRDFTVCMDVDVDGPIDGRSVTEAGLRHLSGVYLVEIVRPERTIAPVAPNQTLRGGDRLVFAGQVDDVVDLRAIRGLTPSEAGAVDILDAEDGLAFFEVVIGAASPIVGRTPADFDFRGRYQGAVLGIHRSGERIGDKIGVVRLRAGDTLLVLAQQGFRRRWRDTGDFLLVSRLDAPMTPSATKGPLALAALAAVVLLPVLGVVSVTRATVAAGVALVLVGVLRPREARDAIDANVVLMIGGAFGLGEAVRASGLADGVATGVIDGFGWAGTAGAVVGLVLATMLLTELITNAAAVALIFPIALGVAEEVALDPRLLMIGLAVAGSASFLTPIGYQTNTMVYGPGGYRFTDYLRLGAPLSLLTVAVVTTLVVLG